MSILLKSVRNTYAPVPDHSFDVIKRNKVWDKAKGPLSFIHSSRSSTLTTCIWTYIHKLLWGCGVFNSCPAHTAQTAHGQASQMRNEQAAAIISSSLQRDKLWANTLEIYISLITSVLSLPSCVASDLKMIHAPEEYALLSLSFPSNTQLPARPHANHLQRFVTVFASYAFHSHFC